MGRVWWVLLRLAMRGRPAAEIERIIQADACSECGSWRCPHCRLLIMVAADHSGACPRWQPWR